MHTSKNYKTDGGDKWVIGGTLEIVEGGQLIGGGAGEPGPKGADGFPTKEQWDDLVARVTALEAAGG